MWAKDVMTKPVISVEPNATILQAARLMLQHRISGLPVVENGKLVGVVSEGDFLRRQETGTERQRPRWLEFLIGPGRLAGEYARSHGGKVGEVMTEEVVTVTEDTPLEDVVTLMEHKQIKRVPVVRGNDIVGIVTRANLLHAMVGLARTAPATEKDDATIRDRLLSELERQDWAPAALTNVTVQDGVVDLWGVIMDERQREAIKVAAENTPGVKTVKDHLTWVEPFSGTVIEPGNNNNKAA